MAQSNVETVRSVYEAFGRGDVPAVLGAMDDKIDWQEPDNVPYENQTGPQAVAENIFGKILADFETFSVNPDEIIDAGDVVLAIGRYKGTSKAGNQLDTQFAHVWRMKDGKAAGFRTYTDTVAWREALGV